MPCFGSAGSAKGEGQPQMGLMAFFPFPPCSWAQSQFSFHSARQACESVKIFILIQNRIPLNTRPFHLVQYQPLSTEGNRKTPWALWGFIPYLLSDHSSGLSSIGSGLGTWCPDAANSGDYICSSYLSSWAFLLELVLRRRESGPVAATLSP